MKRVVKLAVLAGAAVTALAFASNALAVQKLSVSQTATSLTIKVTQAQTDPQTRTRWLKLADEVLESPEFRKKA